MTPRISIIIPALNEADAIADVVRAFLHPHARDTPEALHDSERDPARVPPDSSLHLSTDKSSEPSGEHSLHLSGHDSAEVAVRHLAVDRPAQRVGDAPALFAAECIVVDNGSTDQTATNARNAGARVLTEPRRGYGQACATGAAAAHHSSDVLVFVDGDGSDIPEELPLLVGPVLRGEYDFVLGSRTRGHREPRSLLPSQLFAGWLAGHLIHLRYGVRYTDMGPFRAVSRRAFESLHMSEMTYGWNLEMQMKAARSHLRILEVPVSYRNRQAGTSKVAGSLSGSLKAALRIAQVFLRISLSSTMSS